jgi:hypothetical protein
MRKQFEIGKTYKGGNGVGEVAITIVKRTAQTVWVKTCMDESKACRINTKYCGDGVESIYYRSWVADSGDEYSKEEQMNDSYYAAYHR